MNNPLVSVIIPTFKRPNTLDRSINSVLNQNYQNVEVIVVDDNDPDTEGRCLTEEKMLPFLNNGRVKYVQHVQNKNGAAARNTGAKYSNAKYLAFLDDDDEFLPNKIEDQVNKMESLSDDWAGCYCKRLTEYKGKIKDEDSECREGQLLVEALKRKFDSGAGSNLMVRRDVFNEIGGFNEDFVRNQDLELVAKIFCKYKIAYCERTGVIIHLHLCPHTLDYDRITHLYVEYFTPFIQQQSVTIQNDIYKELNLQRLAFKLYPQKDIKGFVSMLIRKEVKLIDAFKIIVSKIKGFIRRRL